ncbi:hypothetical protein HY439_02970 [Candidatus Microgenomates bacterium]|nr:hypothetical protein [Candidatus Microgenomates bacterium]
MRNPHEVLLSKEPAPAYCRRENGRLHTAGTIVLTDTENGPSAVFITETRTDYGLLKVCGSSSFPVGRVNEDKDGSIEKGAARKTAERELYAETGIKIENPGKLVYLGRFSAPNVTEKPPYQHVLIVTDCSVPFQRIYDNPRQIKPEEAVQTKLKPAQKLIFVDEAGAVIDIFVTYIPDLDIPPIPFCVDGHISDTVDSRAIPLSLFASENHEPSILKRLSPLEKMMLLKSGVATGREELHIPEDYPNDQIFRPYVSKIIQRLIVNLPALQTELGFPNTFQSKLQKYFQVASR